MSVLCELSEVGKVVQIVAFSGHDVQFWTLLLQVEKVVANEHTFVILGSGACLAFGSNHNGQLGLGHRQDVKIPQEVPLDGRFVPCGPQQS